MLSSRFVSEPVVSRRSGTADPVRGGRGFTAVELMVVVLIVAILAAVSYPIYREQVRKARRADAQTVLMQSAQFMERYFTETGSYKDAVLPYTRSPVDGNTTYYKITVAITDSDLAFEVKAEPEGSELDAGVLTLNHIGRRGRDRNGDKDTSDSGEDSW